MRVYLQRTMVVLGQRNPNLTVQYLRRLKGSMLSGIKADGFTNLLTDADMREPLPPNNNNIVSVIRFYSFWLNFFTA